MEHSVKNIEGFNKIWYKDCFFMALFQMLNEQERMFLLLNEVSYLHYSENTKEFQIKYEKNIEGNISELLSTIGYSCDFLFSVNSLDLIKELLDNKYLIILTLDPFYLSNRYDTYNKKHLAHCVLLCGYEEKNIITIDQDYSYSLSYNKKHIPSFEIMTAHQGFIRQMTNPSFIGKSFPEECIINNRFPVLFKIRKTDISKPISVFTTHSTFLAKSLPNVIEASSKLSSLYYSFLRKYDSSDVDEKIQFTEILHKNLLLKKIDYYRFNSIYKNLCDDDSLKDLTLEWELLRTIFAKAIYRQSSNHRYRIRESLCKIAHLETTCYTKLTDYYRGKVL